MSQISGLSGAGSGIGPIRQILRRAERRMAVGARAPPTRSRTNLSVERAAEQGRLVAARHLIVPGDEGRDAVMGSVHLVSLGSDPHEKHFLYDVEGDVNEGQKRIVTKGRSGPFAHRTGSSTVMDRSTHVLYRNRQGTMEITVKRGVLGSEIDLLMSKLAMHRTSVPMSSVVFVKGRKRFRLGSLDSLDFAKLREMVAQCLNQYRTCGILLIETKPGTGAMYKPGVHKSRFKSNARRGKGPFSGK